MKNFDKFYLSTSVAPNNQLITCHVCLPDSVQKCLRFKKQLAKSGLVWSITLSTLLSMHGEIISVLVFAQCLNISRNFTAGS